MVDPPKVDPTKVDLPNPRKQSFFKRLTDKRKVSADISRPDISRPDIGSSDFSGVVHNLAKKICTKHIQLMNVIDSILTIDKNLNEKVSLLLLRKPYQNIKYELDDINAHIPEIKDADLCKILIEITDYLHFNLLKYDSCLCIIAQISLAEFPQFLRMLQEFGSKNAWFSSVFLEKVKPYLEFMSEQQHKTPTASNVFNMVIDCDMQSTIQSITRLKLIFDEFEKATKELSTVCGEDTVKLIDMTARQVKHFNHQINSLLKCQPFDKALIKKSTK